MNCNLSEQENASQCINILTQITIEDENELTEREVFPKTITDYCLLQCFFLQEQTDKSRKRLLDKHSARIPNTAALH